MAWMTLNLKLAFVLGALGQVTPPAPPAPPSPGIPGARATSPAAPAPAANPTPPARAILAAPLAGERPTADPGASGALTLTPAEVSAAIVQLGDDRIAVRDTATDRLWRGGLDIQPALEAARKHPDGEVRLRIESILSRFQYGIFVDTPPALAEQIRRFHRADFESRVTVLRELIAGGEIKTAVALTRGEPNLQLRSAMIRQLADDLRGPIVGLIRQGKIDQVELLLEAGGTGQEAAMMALAAFYAVTGKLDARIETARAELERPPVAHSRRMLIHLLRARGDLASAIEVARRGDDSRLVRALMLEAERWSDLAPWQREHGMAPPLPVDVANQNFAPPQFAGAHAKAISLAYDLAISTRAGLADDARRLAGELKQFAAERRDEQTVVWSAAEGLLISDRSEDAIALLKLTRPLGVFELLAYQNRYQEAFDFAGAKPGRPFDQAWFDSLPVYMAGKAEDANSFSQRFQFASAVARTLHGVGRTTQAREVVTLLDRLAQDAPARDQRKRNRADLLLRLATLEFRLGLLEPAFAHADQLAGEGDFLASIFSNFFGTRQAEAQAWHTLIKQQEPSLSLAKVLVQIHQLMRWPVPAEATEEEYTRWLAPATRFAATIEPKSARAAFVSNLAATYVARDWIVHARTLLEPVAADWAPAAIQLADLDAEQKNWQSAADRYAAAYELDPSRVEALLLAGVANGKLDDEQRRQLGEKQRLHARLIAMSARARHTVAKSLAQRGYVAEAIQEFRLAAATGFFDSWESNDATRLLGDAVAETDPGLASRCWSRSLLGLLTQNDFLEVESYLRVPFLIHKERAKALVAAKDFAGVAAAAAQAFAITPGDVRLPEELVPLLDAAGQRELADRLFSPTYDRLAAIVGEYPECPLHLNNLAWLSARCHRQLDKALELATRATKLAPAIPNYLDTLAEVHFQLGDRDTAVRLSEQAIRMAVRQKTYRDQLTRFQTAKLPR